MTLKYSQPKNTVYNMGCLFQAVKTHETKQQFALKFLNNCDETSDGAGSICSFIRIVKQERVKHQQWEQRGQGRDVVGETGREVGVTSRVSQDRGTRQG